MEAMEFLKLFKRICNGDECTEKCPFDDDKQGCSFHTDNAETIMQKVVNWSKTHPVVTEK